MEASGTETNREQHQEYMKNLVMYLQELDASKTLSPYWLKMMQSHTRCP